MNLRNEFPFASRENRTQTMGALTWYKPWTWLDPVTDPINAASSAASSFITTTGKNVEDLERTVANMAKIIGYSAAALVTIYAYSKFKKVRSGK